MMTSAVSKKPIKEQRIINQVYWESTNLYKQYRNGSVIEFRPRKRVAFKNPLMAAGKVIMKWKSSGNYQSDKTVPPLPMLSVGHRYRLLARLKVTPQNTLIIRLTFYNRQGEQIKQLNLNGFDDQFDYPQDTSTYTVELVNAGCIALDFDRLEIGPADLPRDAYDDLWLQEPIQDVPNQPVNLLLVGANMRAKRTYPFLNRLAGNLAMQVLEVAWQFDGSLTDQVTSLLRENMAYNTHLISTDPQFDATVTAVCRQLPSFSGLVTSSGDASGMHVASYPWTANAGGLQPSVATPNWPVIFRVIQRLWGGE